MNKTRLLNHDEINLKLDRMAWQILESHVKSNLIILVGLINRGATLAEKLKNIIEKHSDTKVILSPIDLDKSSPLNSKITMDNSNVLKDNPVVLVDDVLNSGVTLAAALKEVLKYMPKSVMTAVLANRAHHKFPIQANFVGLSLSTTLKDHILYEEKDGKMSVYLI
ncbi:MAG: phosphoribosyltransferase family protein [Bacteroidia bacterium]|nr:phosphoribosyltransferase family protein [Bacteroidia bacterium]MDG2041547.1 phosphoribosyltransferase family protein [Bacteroidia bacterium]|tara:strand:+ start:4196 stop:4693 length:498 start_codon:yes stop_codon:yes gene_type:complete